MGNAGVRGGAKCDNLQPDRKCVSRQFVAYRRYMKRKISGEMQSRVEETVSKYVEFYSERSGRK